MECHIFAFFGPRKEGKKVTLVVRSKLGTGMVRMIYHALRSKLSKGGVKIMIDTPTLEIDPKGVKVLTPDGESRHISAETVVLAMGAKGNRELLD